MTEIGMRGGGESIFSPRILCESPAGKKYFPRHRANLRKS